MIGHAERSEASGHRKWSTPVITIGPYSLLSLRMMKPAGGGLKGKALGVARLMERTER
jgi:hypothetical protein